MKTIKAFFDGYVFIPHAPVDLSAGSELELSILAAPTVPARGSTLQQLAEIADEFPGNPDLPDDLAAQHDHYLYGTPKRP